ncbi:hypothetical protein DPMN_134517 [Dreissena polymorpha]|uniref:Uncharacterized protein n=1 Tax=Dreissena polymorpha TaxID=45954 RepID=A0A9D4FWA2_DREPO|nr:hypothetical protein DPMN_134517 [Dreissena polymorpha]
MPVASRQSAGLPMNLAIPGLCRHSPGLHLGTTGDNRGVAVALLCRGLFGPRWSNGAVRVVPGAVPVVPGAAPVDAGPSR